MRRGGVFNTIKRIALWIFVAGLIYGVLKLFNFDLIAVGTAVWNWIWTLITGIGDTAASSDDLRTFINYPNTK